MLMEWAVGKGYDLYHPDTGKLLLPGSKISFDIHYHAVGEEIRDDVELAIWLYPKGEEPAHRTYLIPFTGLKGRASLDIAPAGYSLMRSSVTGCAAADPLIRVMKPIAASARAMLIVASRLRMRLRD